jgi:hypothetical protein
MLGYKLVELYSEEELASSVKSVEQMFPEDIEHIRYTVKEDWTYDPAIFFRILLKDKTGAIAQAARRHDDSFKPFFALMRRIESELRAAVADFHLPVYFAFRLVSEQREIKEPIWD